MNSILLRGAQRESCIYTRASIDEIEQLAQREQMVIITDRNVYELVGSRLPQVPTYKVQPGEHSKSLRNASNIYRWLQEQRADRNVFLVGVGGGVVCDLTGFIAATYMRGVDFALAPTTLLCQVDASIGGKNALNLYGFKNVVGTVYQPNFILCDHSILHTLPEDEVQGGIAEMIKHAMIQDAPMFARFENEHSGIMHIEHPLIDELIEWSINVKKEHIEADEHDKGIRRRLNFGHTWGHAVESVTGLHHGLAIGVGMVFATRFAIHRGICSPETEHRLIALLKQFGMPTETKASKWVLYETLQKDKKRTANTLHFALPECIGNVNIHNVSLDDLHAYIKQIP